MVMPAGTSISLPSILIVGIATLPALFRCQLFGARADAALHFRPEMPDQSLDRPRRAVGERANRVAFDLLGDVVQRIDLLDPRVARDHPLHHAPDPTESLAAGRALATALVLVEVGQTGDRLDDVGRLVHDDDRCRAEAALLVLQRVEVHQDRVADRLGQHRRRRTTGNDGQQVVPAAAYAAGMLLDQLLEGNAHRLFDVARLVHVPGDAEEFGAGVVGTAESSEPGRALAQDRRRHRDRLDIVHRRGAAVEAGSRGERRLEPRHALLAFEALEQRRLLAADVGAGAAMNVDLELPARTAGIVAEQTGVARFLDRFDQMLRLVVELAAHIDVG